MLKVVVDFEDNTFLEAFVVALYAIGCDGKIGRARCRTDVNIVLVVGDKFAAGPVAIVEIERVVAHHYGVVVERVAIVQAVVVAAAHVGRRLQLGARVVEPADEDVRPVGEIDCRAALVLQRCAAVEAGVVCSGCDRKVGRPSGAEYQQLVERVDIHTVWHIG